MKKKNTCFKGILLNAYALTIYFMLWLPSKGKQGLIDNIKKYLKRSILTLIENVTASEIICIVRENKLH